MRTPKLVTEGVDWFVYLGWRQAFGFMFAAAGVALTIYAVRTDPKNQLLIAVVAAFAQIMAALFFSRQGKADPTHAKRSVQRLISLSSRVSRAESAATSSFESDAKDKLHGRMGLLSVELGYIGEGIRDAVFDWTAFNDHLFELLSDSERGAAASYIAALKAGAAAPGQPLAPGTQGGKP